MVLSLNCNQFTENKQPVRDTYGNFFFFKVLLFPSLPPWCEVTWYLMCPGGKHCLQLSLSNVRCCLLGLWNFTLKQQQGTQNTNVPLVRNPQVNSALTHNQVSPDHHSSPRAVTTMFSEILMNFIFSTWPLTSAPWKIYVKKHMFFLCGIISCWGVICTFFRTVVHLCNALDVPDVMQCFQMFLVFLSPG